MSKTVIVMLVVSVLIVLIVVGLFLLATNKAYSYKHTIDKPENEPLEEIEKKNEGKIK